MSFGFSVGDCILLLDIARTQYNNCVAAGPEYREIAREVKTLHNVLELLRHESSNVSFARGDQRFETQLAPAINGCKHILEDLQTLITKYEGLSDNGKAVNPTRKLWHKIRFSSKIQALGEVRSKIIFYTTTISVLLDAMQLRATGRLEDKLDATNTAMVDGFQSIKLVMVEEVLKARTVSRRESSTSLLSLSTYNEDDKKVWQEFRRELIAKGFGSNQLDKHKDMLQAYMLKLEQTGVLDEVGMVESMPQDQNLEPIGEEEDLATAMQQSSIRPRLVVEPSLDQSSRPPPPRDRRSNLPILRSVRPAYSTSNFLRTMITHAVSQGPQALQQTLDLYPELSQDPYLSDYISAEPSGTRHNLRAIVATARQRTMRPPEEFQSNSQFTPRLTGNQPSDADAPKDQDLVADKSEAVETTITKSRSDITPPASVEPGIKREVHIRFEEPNLTCARCTKPHIEYELHYNCTKCEQGNWDICIDCFRAGKGCHHWFGFGYGSWIKWEFQTSSGVLPPGTEAPHFLTANRFTALKTPNGAADARQTLPNHDPKDRLQSGVFCSNCLGWANGCYWKCDHCNQGDWGFCNTCVNQGKCCTHALLPMAYQKSERGTILPSQHIPSPAAFLTGPDVVAVGNFKPLTFSTSCDICFNSIPPSESRYHCYSCTSSVSGTDPPGDYDICTMCYYKLGSSRSISAENVSWRRCLKGHRMVIIRFEESRGGQRRVVLNDLVGGRTLREDISSSIDFSTEASNFVRWSWSEASKWRYVSTNVMDTVPISFTEAQYHPSFTGTEFPPDGGAGMKTLALWSWFPGAGVSDELLFPRGAEVTEVVKVNEDWFYGVYMGAKGLFPSSYVKRITNEDEKEVIGTMNGKGHKGNDTLPSLKTLHDQPAQNGNNFQQDRASTDLQGLLPSVDSNDLEEEILRQIREDGLLDEIDLENINVEQEDQIIEMLVENYRKRNKRTV